MHAISAPHQQCAMGFLSGESRRMIIQDMRTSNLPGPTPLNYLGIPSMATGIQLTHCGSLRKIVIAAKFNITMPDGWPKIRNHKST